MSRRTSLLIVAGLTALSLGSGAYARDPFPVSINETGPVSPQHAAAPNESVGASTQQAPNARLVSEAYEVQTPSSVNETASGLPGKPGR